LILFNNFYYGGWQSAVYELVPPLNSNGTYDLNTDGTFGPIAPVWLYAGDFFSWIQSGAFRLPNGNTIITVTTAARIIEVENNLNIVWDYQFDGGQMIARAQKYPLDYLFPQYSIGDVNFDQSLGLTDVLMISDMVSGVGYSPTPPADVNQDGSVDISDVVFLVQTIMGN